MAQKKEYEWRHVFPQFQIGFAANSDDAQQEQQHLRRRRRRRRPRGGRGAAQHDEEGARPEGGGARRRLERTGRSLIAADLANIVFTIISVLKGKSI